MDNSLYSLPYPNQCHYSNDDKQGSHPEVILSGGLYNKVGSYDGLLNTSIAPLTRADQMPSTVQCTGCKAPITDRYLLNVAGCLWHEKCLKCNECERELCRESSCFVKAGKVLCRVDYDRLFLVRCTSCALPIRPADMIQRVGTNIYHSGCFACSFCGKQLHPGDEYLQQENQILCRLDFENFFQSSFSNAFQMNPFPHNVQRKALKRPRTILTSQQRKTFKASFEVSAKPCRKVREALAKETGLSVRVVQVWFQNQRAKMKKVHRKIEGKRSCSEDTPEIVGQIGQGGNEKTSSKDCTSSSLSDFESISESHSCPHTLDSPSSDSTSEGEQDMAEQTECGKSIEEAEKREKVASHSKSLTMESSPIDRLYFMQSSYFSY
ncbi:LIM homeobox transcription factor 1 beta [Trichuris trichiura]|uniref:LIM homeobox transcription factor 1 beta n=1 Tax=Trichuris trichiura TaxID=36087 RepID=A0A077Z0S8_TRITR|nr:LIM homeobox transcription factor 1 beta [Trichuris trichiura]